MYDHKYFLFFQEKRDKKGRDRGVKAKMARQLRGTSYLYIRRGPGLAWWTVCHCAKWKNLRRCHCSVPVSACSTHSLAPVWSWHTPQILFDLTSLPLLWAVCSCLDLLTNKCFLIQANILHLYYQILAVKKQEKHVNTLHLC